MPYRHDFARALGIEVPIAATVFGLVVLAMLIALAVSRARRRRGTGSSQKAEANRVELSYLVVLALAAAFLATTSLTINNRETSAQTDPAITVLVTGYQWCWRFHYAGRPVTVDGQCQQGKFPVLVLPAHRPVRFVVTSSDVIHGFWLSYLRWKIYAYPDHRNAFTVTFDHTGTWTGRCSEFCGLYHLKMDYQLRVVPPSRFAGWLRAHSGRVRAEAGS
jgi:cytochrome c oxidase subunit II